MADKPEPIKIEVEDIPSEAVIFDEKEGQVPMEELRDKFIWADFPEKESDSIIIQSCVSTHGPFDEALEWLKPIHGAYCERWGYDYLANSKPVIEIYNEEDRKLFSHAWDKIVLLRDAFHFAGYEYAYWIDHDCVIVDFDTDLKSAFEPGKDIMMCVHPGAPSHGLPSHFNAGVMAVRNTERTRHFIEIVLNNRYSGPPWFEQDVMNGVFTSFDWMDIVGVMDDKFNSTPNANEVPIEQAVIAAFHGMGGYHDVNTRLDMMKEAAKVRKVDKQIEKIHHI